MWIIIFITLVIFIWTLEVENFWFPCYKNLKFEVDLTENFSSARSSQTQTHLYTTCIIPSYCWKWWVSTFKTTNHLDLTRYKFMISSFREWVIEWLNPSNHIQLSSFYLLNKSFKILLKKSYLIINLIHFMRTDLTFD